MGNYYTFTEWSHWSLIYLFSDDISISSSKDLESQEDYDPENISLANNSPELDRPAQFRERLFNNPRQNSMDRTNVTFNSVQFENNGDATIIHSDSNSLNSERSTKKTRIKGCGKKVLMCSIL